jgi:TetR/AcrR family transcriptional regulator, mexJK operon transcriptional repressor
MPPRPSWLNHNDPETVLAEQLASHYDRLEKLGLHRVLPELLPHDPELTEVFAEARRKLHGSIYEGLKQARDLGFTWNDLDLGSVAWSIIVLTENIPKMDIDTDANSDYHVVAKIICRSVFPPDVLVQLKSGEKSF